MTYEDEKFLIRNNSGKSLCGDILPIRRDPVVIEPVKESPPRPVNLIVGIPTGMSNDFEWTKDFAVKFVTRMCPPNSGLIFENRYGIAQARESIVNQFIQNPLATHLLFFDSDILPIELHGVNTLIADTLTDPKKYIVVGLYYNSLYSGLNCWKNEIALKLQDLQQYTDPVVEVDKVGMGYTIIRKDLFQVLTLEERPLFFYKIQEGNVMKSEDFVFFDKLAKYGIHPFVDSRVTAQHIKRCKVNADGGIQF
ncbi:MAG TPA: hypothetical protein VKA95_11355 [Nitrososphaeraceae archaeon]|nr:hypothetical protein [Nitrososphaeraceae archaeon]